jgi:hypothetical protein
MAKSFSDKSVFHYGRQILSLLAFPNARDRRFVDDIARPKPRYSGGARIVAAAGVACAGNDVELSWLYLDLILIALARYAPEGFEAKMNSLGYKYESYFGRRYYGYGKAEGQADGWAEGRIEISIKLLALRFGPLTEAAQARVRDAQDAQLDAVAERMLTAKTLEEAVSPLL